MEANISQDSRDEIPVLCLIASGTAAERDKREAERKPDVEGK